MNSSKDVHRQLKISLPRGQSAFLWGPRKTGKTTLLHQLFPNSLRYDLLETDTFMRLNKEPHLLREELKAMPHIAQPVIIDEVQKIPALLDEIHSLIESEKMSFILCGSSARKLKRGHANMLGGRAWRFELFPLTTRELGKNFDLLTAVNHGLLPSHYFASQYKRSLKAYIQDYLREEIQYEGLVRNLPAFSRFLDAVPFCMGELVNYTNIARDCGVDAKTVAEYFQILVDTLLGTFLEPFRKKRKRAIITETPKFYLFDVGVAGGLVGRIITGPKGEEFGRAFEHLILMELLAYRFYSENDFRLSFWRTTEGREVDFVLGSGEVAIEVKGSVNVGGKELRGLRAFLTEHTPQKSIVVCQEKRPRVTSDGIHILPWSHFLDQLWGGNIV